MRLLATVALPRLPVGAGCGKAAPGVRTNGQKWLRKGKMAPLPPSPALPGHLSRSIPPVDSLGSTAGGRPGAPGCTGEVQGLWGGQICNHVKVGLFWGRAEGGWVLWRCCMAMLAEEQKEEMIW